MPELGELVSGAAPTSGRLGNCLAHLRTILDVLDQDLVRPVTGLSASERLIRPFLTRSLLEVGCTSLIGRLDAFRLLAVAELQSQPTYDVGERLAAAIQWTGDVLSSDKSQKDLWSTKVKPADMSRALLGDYHDHLTIRPAFTALLDHIAVTPKAAVADGWVSELRGLAPNNITPWLRGQLSKLYSATSKGVHHEFVLSLSSYYDDVTLEEQVEDARKVLSCLALVVNHAEAATYRLSADHALDLFLTIQDA